MSTHKTVTKTCKTLLDAEQQQDKLYGEYDSVQLISSPRFSENGRYIWEVQ